jgi:uracil-DNA glycosylase
MTSHTPSLAREIDAALVWWHAAGVDCDFADDARAWMADDAPMLAPSAASSSTNAALAAPTQAPLVFGHRLGEHQTPESTPRKNYLGESRPHGLADFQRWWMEADLPAQSTLHPRIPPRGEADAKLMVIVADPEADDRSTLLGGPQGRLLANILAAMGLAESDCYFASALPCHTPLADLAGLAHDGLDAVLSYHITLVAPERLVLFGQGLGAFLPHTSGSGEDNGLGGSSQIGLTPPVMVTETLGSMLDAPALKAKFWRRWIKWAA